MGSSSACCNKAETLGDIAQEKIIGYNTHQKISELKAYRFFINHLINLMMVNNGVENKEFYFIRKSWINSWAKYTCYQQIRPLLIKNEINNELDFQKTIIDHKKELNFEGFTEKTKPGPIRFFEINKLNTNIKENFYIFDSKILKQFIDVYEYEDINNEGKETFALKGEIGKGRIIFDVKEYTLIMFLNKNWDIKQIMVIFGTQAEHKHFVKSVKGRALTFISKELKKISQKKKMITYKKDEIFVYDNRDFIKYEYNNNNHLFKMSNIISKDNKENEQVENLNKNSKNKNLEFDKLTNLFEPIVKTNENESKKIKGNIKIDEFNEKNENQIINQDKINNNIENKENNDENIINANNENKDFNEIDDKNENKENNEEIRDSNEINKNKDNQENNEKNIEFNDNKEYINLNEIKEKKDNQDNNEKYIEFNDNKENIENNINNDDNFVKE